MLSGRAYNSISAIIPLADLATNTQPANDALTNE